MDSRASSNNVAVDKNRKPDLFYAIEHNDIQLMRTLLAAKADPDLTDSSGKTALLHAINENDNKETVITLLENKADPNREGAINKGILSFATPLILATYDKNKDLIQELIKAKADINLATSTGSRITTPLLVAVHCNRQDTITALLEAKADLNKEEIKTDPSYQKPCLPPLLQTVRQSKNTQDVQFLLDKKADIEMRDLLGNTALFHAANNRYELTSWDNIKGISITMMDLLLSHKANIDALNLEGTSVLSDAVKRRQINQIEFLLEHGAKIISFDELFKLIKSENQLSDHTYSFLNHLVKQLKQQNLPYAMEEAHLNKLTMLRNACKVSFPKKYLDERIIKEDDVDSILQHPRRRHKSNSSSIQHRRSSRCSRFVRSYPIYSCFYRRKT